MSPFLHVPRRRRVALGRYAREFPGGSTIEFFRGGFAGTEPLTMAWVGLLPAYGSSTNMSVMGLSSTDTTGGRTMRVSTSGALYYWDHSSGGLNSGIVVPLNVWVLLVVMKDAARQEHAHMYRFDTQAWTNARNLGTGGAISAANTGTDARWTLGSSAPGNGAQSVPAGTRAAGMGAWALTMTQAQVHSLVSGAAARRSAWLTAAGGPNHLWPLSQSSISTAVEDVVGTADQEAVRGTGQTIHDAAGTVPWTD